MKIGRILFSVVIIVSAYFIFWPLSVTPVAWQAPKDLGFVKEFSENTDLRPLEYIEIDGDNGPEDLAIDKNGFITVSLHSGAIVKMDESGSALIPWVNTGGRPLGIEFDAMGNLIVADAYLGLLSVSPKGEIATLSDTAQNIPILYADDLDISDDGKIYFSDASTKFAAKTNQGTLAASLLDILEHGGHGRLLMYDPVTKLTTTLLTGINFANGVAVSHDQRSVLYNETGSYRVMRYWLKGEKTGEIDVVIDNLPGFPDNIARSASGGYWLGLVSTRSEALDALSNWPFLRKVMQRLPVMMRPEAQEYGHVVRISEKGEVLQSLQDPSGEYPLTTGVLETSEFLYVSSLTADKLARKALD
jgi:sugar lactone lactonase YvrE